MGRKTRRTKTRGEADEQRRIRHRRYANNNAETQRRSISRTLEEKANQTDKGKGKGGDADEQRRGGSRRRDTADEEEEKQDHCLDHCIYDCRDAIKKE
eukprot:8798576-Heterocapsa_arctica.AAC.1